MTAVKKKYVSEIEESFAFQLKCAKIKYEREYHFAAVSVGGTGKGVRKRLNDANLKNWRFDFAFIDHMVAVELEGGIFIGGRHVTGPGFMADCEKYNSAVCLGWRLLRFTSKEVRTGQGLLILERLLAANLPV